VCQFLISEGHQIISKNTEIFHVEVDVLFKSRRGELWIVEVKTRSHLDYLETAVGFRQRQRLKRVAQALSEQGSAVRLILAVVHPQTGAIRWLPNFFD
jgi:Holliday junction resolvase-like predicted endonuclease